MHATEVTKPMSYRSRIILAIAGFLIFLAAVPPIVLYANGYRFFSNTDGSDSSIAVMGGISIAGFEDGSSFYIDGNQRTTTGFFSNTFFVQDIIPGIHSIDIMASGTRAWHKEVSIEPSRVASLSPFLPLDPVISKVVVQKSSTASSTRTIEAITPEQYAHVKSLLATTSPLVATSSASAIVRDDVAVWVEKGKTLFAEWRGSAYQRPSFFCSLVHGSESCTSKVIIPVESEMQSVDFVPQDNNALLVLTTHGLMAVEIDGRPTRTVVPLYQGAHIRARVIDGQVYVLDGSKIVTVLF